MDNLVRGTYQEASDVELPTRRTRPLPLRPRPRVRARPALRHPRGRVDAAALVPAARSRRVAARVLATPGRDGLLRAGRRRHPDAAAGRQRRGVLLTVRVRRPGWPPAAAPTNRRAPAPR